jgi:hypothetical protein
VIRQLAKKNKKELASAALFAFVLDSVKENKICYDKTNLKVPLLQ